MRLTHKLDGPILQLNMTTMRMIPLMEFIERLKVSQRQRKFDYRICDNEQEDSNREVLKGEVAAYFKEHGQLHPTFWAQAQEVLRPPSDSEEKRRAKKQKPVAESIGKVLLDRTKTLIDPTLPEDLQMALDWAKVIESLVPRNAYQPTSLRDYA